MHAYMIAALHIKTTIIIKFITNSSAITRQQCETTF